MHLWVRELRRSQITPTKYISLIRGLLQYHVDEVIDKTADFSA